MNSVHNNKFNRQFMKNCTQSMTAVISMLLSLIASDLRAQQSSKELEEILVTAQRRTQNLQNVPISISV